jgi:hypothetical protein
MRPHSAYFTSVLGATCAALCFAVTLALPTAIVAPKVAPKPDANFSSQASDTITDTINRASKGDRLRVIVRPPEAEPFEVKAPEDAHPGPPDGCQSAFGQMDHSPAAKRAQACIT